VSLGLLVDLGQREAGRLDDGSLAFGGRQREQLVAERVELVGVCQPPVPGSAVGGRYSAGDSAGLPSR